MPLFPHGRPTALLGESSLLSTGLNAGRCRKCRGDSDDAECAIITFLTGVIQGGASSPRIFIIFINALLEHLTSTGKALGISHGMVGTEQFNNIAFMDDITTLAQDSWLANPVRLHSGVRRLEQHAAKPG